MSHLCVFFSCTYPNLSIYFVTEVSCGAPGKTPNTTVTVAAEHYQAKAIYRCDIGYEQTGGDINRLCDADGKWTGSALECQSKYILISFSKIRVVYH